MRDTRLIIKAREPLHKVAALGIGLDLLSLKGVPELQQRCHAGCHVVFLHDAVAVDGHQDLHELPDLKRKARLESGKMAARRTVDEHGRDAATR